MLVNAVSGGTRSAILAAAMALPSVLPAQAETAPERGLIAFKVLEYEDSQPGFDRIRVSAPSLEILAPVADEWAVDAVFTVDSISGASPAFHTVTASAGRLVDRRHGETVGLTRYLPRASVSVRASFSGESDYESRALSVAGSISSDDNNTTLNLGVGGVDDSINPNNRIVVDETKKTQEFLVGVTQVLGRQDIAQLTLTHSDGRGYYSDPYKFLDNRPRTKRQDALTLRWNHHFAGIGASSRLSYRYYVDSFGVKADTLTAEWVQPLPTGWTLIPSLRLYSQRAASFYLPPETPGLPTIPPGFVFGQTIMSMDQRLSAFGARTAGFKLVRQFGPDWSVDYKFEFYEQRGSWAHSDQGSGGLAPFYARSSQFGISRSF